MAVQLAIQLTNEATMKSELHTKRQTRHRSKAASCDSRVGRVNNRAEIRAPPRDLGRNPNLSLQSCQTRSHLSSPRAIQYAWYSWIYFSHFQDPKTHIHQHPEWVWQGLGKFLGRRE